MATYRISGVWKDINGVITHYAFHKVETDHTSRAVKTSKSQAIALLTSRGNDAVTWLWNYKRAAWDIGETVHVIGGTYLRSNPDDRLTDNLGHLIDYDWIAS